jgi:hypothetical protein
MSPAGSFRTATVQDLTEFFDPNDGSEQRKAAMFPSASTVAIERQALNIECTSMDTMARTTTLQQ